MGPLTCFIIFLFLYFLSSYWLFHSSHFSLRSMIFSWTISTTLTTSSLTWIFQNLFYHDTTVVICKNTHIIWPEQQVSDLKHVVTLHWNQHQAVGKFNFVRMFHVMMKRAEKSVQIICCKFLWLIVWKVFHRTLLL